MNPETNHSGHYDVIVIGSGIGGATAGILLGRYFKKRVLLIEKHWQFGGLTHEFTFDGKSFATGLHYIGSVSNGSIPDKLFDIITGGRVSWLPMPHRYDEIILPDYHYALPASSGQLLEELSAQFPKEKEALTRFMRDMDIAFRFLGVNNVMRSFTPRFIHRLLRPLTRMLGFNPDISLQAYLDQNFQDATLKALLAAQWCDYGVLPEEASFLVHAMISKHYREGAYYPEGGPRTIAQGMYESLSRYGADVMLNTAVTRILTQEKKAYGVEVQAANGETSFYTADQIISNAGAVATYQQLLPDHTFDFMKRDATFLSARYDFFSVYISLKKSPKTLGFDGANKWIFRTQDHSHAILPPSHPDYPGFYCLLFPSLKARDKENHTVEILTMIDYSVFRPWEKSAWKQRDNTYYALKEEITERILANIENRYPGFRALIQSHDSSTTLTTEKFLSRARGSSYGVPFTTRRLEMDWLSNKTPIRNLYLSGQDAFGPGVMAAMMGGAGAAAKALGAGPLGYIRIMREVTRHQIRRGAADMQPSLKLQVRRIWEETPDAYTIELEQHPELTYRAGQFVVLDVPVNGKHLKRSYSLSSAPDDPFPTLTIKRIPKGVVSNYLYNYLEPTDQITASFPKGEFYIHPQETGKDILLVAAGSGITPLFSILKDTLENQVENHIHLLYASKSPEQTLFKAQLDHLAKAYPAYLKVTYCYSQTDTPTRPASRLNAVEVLACLNEFNADRTLVYVCAPGEVVGLVQNALEAISFPEQHFHYESFSAAGLLSASTSVQSMAAQLTYLYKGKRHMGEAKTGETLLAAMLKEQMPIDHSCMSGDCEVCRCTLIKGDVRTVKGRRQKDLHEGDTILPCISYAQSDEVILA